MDNVLINFTDDEFCVEKWNGNKSLHLYIDKEGINIHTYIDKKQALEDLEMTWGQMDVFPLSCAQEIHSRFEWINKKGE